MKRKICVITGSRAEYGLLYWLIKGVADDIELELQLIVTGMHLSPEFGLTYQRIEKEFPINKKIEILLSSGSSVGISKAIGLAQISFAEAFDELHPDIVVVLGDRFEIFAAVSSAITMYIPVVHINGGETTEGAIDELYRHSMTKMSSLHFTSTEQYRQRVIQRGEYPETVFNVGLLSLDNIYKLPLIDQNEFEKQTNFLLASKNILLTYHPETNSPLSPENQLSEILTALNKFKHTNILITGANADEGGNIINKILSEYAKNNNDRVKFIQSLGVLRYLSALQYFDIVVGNSSSGIVEVPSFKKATVNIGDRQKGRIRAKSIIDCSCEAIAIQTSIQKAYSFSFQELLTTVKNPFGNSAGISTKIIKILKTYPLNKLLPKKFYDIPHSNV